MTVAELIEELKEFDQNATVVVSHHDEGSDQWIQINAQEVVRGTNENTVWIL